MRRLDSLESEQSTMAFGRTSLRGSLVCLVIGNMTRRIAIISGLCGLLALGTLGLVSLSSEEIKVHTEVGSEPNLAPDYTDLVIPPNVAPLNFQVQEQGTAIEVFSRTPQIHIPLRKWQARWRVHDPGRHQCSRNTD